jgi:hypothetical protein
VLVPPTTGRLLVKRGGSRIIRSVPKQAVVVDTRKPAPYLLTRLRNSIAGVRPGTVEATYDDVWSLHASGHTEFLVTGVCGTLETIEAHYEIPVIYTSADRDLVEAKLASLASKHHAYHWLEQHGLGRMPREGDLENCSTIM